MMMHIKLFLLASKLWRKSKTQTQCMSRAGSDSTNVMVIVSPGGLDGDAWISDANYIYYFIGRQTGGSDNGSEKVSVDSEKLGCSLLLLVQSNEFSESIPIFFCFRIAFCNLTWIVHFDNLQSWPNQNQLEHHRYKSLPTGGSDRKHLPFMRPKCTQFQIIPFSSRSKVNSLWFPAFVEWNSNEASLTAVASFTHSFEIFPLSLPRRTPSCIDFILTLSIRRHNYYRHIENSHFFCGTISASHCNIAVEIAHSMVLLILLNSEIDWATTAVLVVTPEKTHSLIVIIYICQFVNNSPFAVRKTSKPSNELLQTCCMLLSFESSKKVWRAFETLQFYYYGQLLFFFCHRSLHSRQCAAFCKHSVCDDEMTTERYVWLKQVTL